MKHCILLLTCANQKEAEKISQILLEKKLVVCIKTASVRSSFLWHKKINHASEVLLIMDSVERNFDKIKEEVKKIHSYETFVLTSSLVNKTTPEVEKWIEEELL